MKTTKKCFKLSLISTLLIIAIVFSLLSDDTTTSKAEGNKFMRYYNGNEVLYVNIENCIDEWWKDDCTHRVYFFGKDTAWGTLEETPGTGLYQVTVPKGQYSNLIICRCKDNNSTWDNNGVYNQTGDIAILPELDFICIFNGENSSVAGWTDFNNATAPIMSTAINTGSATNNVTRDNSGNNTQGGVILHAFCWTYDEIKNNMADIANAGYTAIQTSPVQQPKDYSPSYTDTKGQWWKLYQPLSYSIGANSWLGNKEDLKEMCKEAKKYGIEVIVDIVSNHLAGAANNQAVFHADVAKYEPTIYNDQATFVHSYKKAEEYSPELVVQGNIGMPDIVTSNHYIQERVISLLKECIDCGVDGFRFDAAKHIETPDDYNYASDFWPNVIGSARNYGKQHNKDLFIYGELLSPMMGGRKYSSYTKYMNIIDNRTSDLTLAAVYRNNANSASNCHYETGEKASNLVLWAESHDVHMGLSGSSGDSDLRNTEKVDDKIINKAYAIIGSRADATALFLARPAKTMGKAETTNWKSPEVSAINYFHKEFNGAKEYLSNNNNNVVINERYFENGKQGAVLTNIRNYSDSISIKTNILKDGKYIDSITKKIFTVSNGYMSGVIGNTGIAVLYPYE